MANSRSVVILALVGTSCGCSASPAEDGDASAGDEATATRTEDDSGGPSPTTGIEPDVCEDPQPILQSDGVTPSGFERCADGFIQKTVEAECIVPPIPESCEGEGECSTSAECNAFPNGACVDRPGVLEGCGCMYACTTDADCAAGSICLCTGLDGIPWPTCVPAGCNDPVACPSSVCGLEIRPMPCGDYTYQLACWFPGSECRVECEPELTCAGIVAPPPCEIVNGQWICNEESFNACGDCG